MRIGGEKMHGMTAQKRSCFHRFMIEQQENSNDSRAEQAKNRFLRPATDYSGKRPGAEESKGT